MFAILEAVFGTLFMIVGGVTLFHFIWNNQSIPEYGRPRLLIRIFGCAIIGSMLILASTA